MKKTQFEQSKPYKPGVKVILSCLYSERQWLMLLMDKNKVYEPLLHYLYQNDEEFEDLEIPTVKVISDNLDIKPSKATNWITNIYNDICDLNFSNPELFKSNGIRYELIFTENSWKAEAVFTLWLDIQFHLYDSFNWYFIEGLMDNFRASFYVSGIFHDGTQKGVTKVYLTSGLYNSYRQFLMDKAKFLSLLTTTELYNLQRHELDRLLIQRVEKGNRSYHLSDEKIR